MDRILSQFEDVAAVTSLASGVASWTAREIGSGRRVLIKRLPEVGGKSRATQTLALRDPRMVPTRRWMMDGESLYLVRDWVNGANLRQTLAQKAQRAFDRLHTRLIPLLDETLITQDEHDTRRREILAEL